MVGWVQHLVYSIRSIPFLVWTVGMHLLVEGFLNSSFYLSGVRPRCSDEGEAFHLGLSISFSWMCQVCVGIRFEWRV